MPRSPYSLQKIFSSFGLLSVGSFWVWTQLGSGPILPWLALVLTAFLTKITIEEGLAYRLRDSVLPGWVASLWSAAFLLDPILLSGARTEGHFVWAGLIYLHLILFIVRERIQRNELRSTAGALARGSAPVVLTNPWTVALLSAALTFIDTQLSFLCVVTVFAYPVLREALPHLLRVGLGIGVGVAAKTLLPALGGSETPYVSGPSFSEIGIGLLSAAFVIWFLWVLVLLLRTVLRPHTVIRNTQSLEAHGPFLALFSAFLLAGIPLAQGASLGSYAFFRSILYLGVIVSLWQSPQLKLGHLKTWTLILLAVFTTHILSLSRAL